MVEWILGKIKKKERKYERNFFGKYLVRRESEIFCGGTQVFSS